MYSQEVIKKYPIKYLILFYRELQYCFAIVTDIAHSWIAGILNVALGILTICLFCLLECYEKCGIFQDVFAFAEAVIVAIELQKSLSLAATVTEQSEGFSLSHLKGNKWKFTMMERKWLTSCQSIRIPLASFGNISKSTFDWIVNLLVTF